MTDTLRAASVPLQTGLKAGATLFTPVYTQFVIRQPRARIDLGL